MSADRYFAADRDRTAEGERLRTLAAFYDPPTQDWLTTAVPLSPGARVLEFGFGAGTMLAWFAAQVGPRGEVLGIDRDAGHAPTLAAPARTRIGDILAEPDAPGRFDLVYARLLLDHLPDPAAALARMTAWTARGGAVAVIGLDCATVRAADHDHPDAAAFDAASAELCARLARSGLMDPVFGTKLADLMGAAGLTDVRETRFERDDASGSAWARFQAANTRLIGAMIDAEACARAAAAPLERAGLRYTDQTLVAVVGRVPA